MLYDALDNPLYKEKMRSDDRILVLRPKEGMKAVAVGGIVDPRLFQGDNVLHAILDPQTSLWSMRYEQGVLPEPLKQRFTNFSALRKHAELYFSKRNIEIVEVID